MTTAPTTLTVAEFIERRLAEDEAVAQRQVAAGDSGFREPWAIWVHHDGQYTCIDPARVLAQVAALRQIVEQYEMTQPPASGADYAVEQELELVLRALASIWRGHDEYRQEWAA